MPMMIGGVAILLIALVGYAVVQAVNSTGSGSNFEFDVYQGNSTLGGDKVSLNDVLALNKPIVLNFWAGDCPPCRAEMPAFQRVHEENGGDVLFLGLDVGIFTGLGNEASARRLLDELRISYPIGAPPDRSAVLSYAVRSMPTTVFFDANGKIVDRVDGAMNEFRLANIVDDLLEIS
ncbi:MAG: TlpA disulfide reductase family protein [SAR202 cluster bacterium]|nr:TlpA disulfide reductase family protein [SAR202 cluster bacterium]